jgi:hypothetical protein
MSVLSDRRNGSTDLALLDDYYLAPNKPLFLAKYGAMLAKRNPLRADFLTQRAAERSPDDFQVRWLRAQCLQLLNRQHEALETYKMTVDLYKRTPIKDRQLSKMAGERMAAVFEKLGRVQEVR